MVGLAGACRQPEPEAAQQPPAPRATPAPPFVSPIAATSRDSVVAYARSLVFDTSHAASDARYLVLRRSGRLTVGPWAHFAPEIGSATLSRDQAGTGRVVARIVTNGPVPEMGLATGTNYVWVDSVGGSFRLVMVPEDATQPVRWTPLKFREHRRAGPVAAEPPTARFTGGVEGRVETCWPCWLTWCYDDYSSEPQVLQ
jgi:hypothetical protein